MIGITSPNVKQIYRGELLPSYSLPTLVHVEGKEAY